MCTGCLTHCALFANESGDWRMGQDVHSYEGMKTLTGGLARASAIRLPRGGACVPPSVDGWWHKWYD